MHMYFLCNGLPCELLVLIVCLLVSGCMGNFTPLLHDVGGGKLKSVRYKPGARGPQEADELSKRMGYVQTHGYIWVPTLSKV